MKIGWDLIRHESQFKNIALDFACLSNGLKYGEEIDHERLGPFDLLQTEGNCISCPEKLRDYFQKSWKHSKNPNLNDYDYFLIIDGLSPLDTRNLYASDQNISPFSNSVITEIIQDLLTKPKKVSSHPINVIKLKTPEKCIFIGAPLPSSHCHRSKWMQTNLSEESKNHITENAIKVRTICEKGNLKLQTHLPPLDVLDKTHVWTKPEYFRNGLNYLGEHHKRVVDHDHANGHYGKSILTDLLIRLIDQQA